MNKSTMNNSYVVVEGNAIMFHTEIEEGKILMTQHTIFKGESVFIKKRIMEMTMEELITMCKVNGIDIVTLEEYLKKLKNK